MPRCLPPFTRSVSISHAGRRSSNGSGNNGVDKARFAERFASPEIQELVGKATQLQDAYGVEGVPALGVAGRFYTDGSIATTMERALQVVDFLLAEVRSGR